jgi:hypothetical protein
LNADYSIFLLFARLLLSSRSIQEDQDEQLKKFALLENRSLEISAVIHAILSFWSVHRAAPGFVANCNSRRWIAEVNPRTTGLGPLFSFIFPNSRLQGNAPFCSAQQWMGDHFTDGQKVSNARVRFGQTEDCPRSIATVRRGHSTEMALSSIDLLGLNIRSKKTVGFRRTATQRNLTSRMCPFDFSPVAVDSDGQNPAFCWDCGGLSIMVFSADALRAHGRTAFPFRCDFPDRACPTDASARGEAFSTLWW